MELNSDWVLDRRMVGGRTNHWGRISLRFWPNTDFKEVAWDGLGWKLGPIGYEDVPSPMYDKWIIIGVFWHERGGFTTEPDGFFIPPPNKTSRTFNKKKRTDKYSMYRLIPSIYRMLTRGRLITSRCLLFYLWQMYRACQAVMLTFQAELAFWHPAIGKKVK